MPDGPAGVPTPEPIPLAKLRPPTLHPRHVARAALTTRLADAWRSPVTLVSAPAGFGKTSALVAALGADPARVAWVALDERDDDPQRFFRLVGAALQSVTGHGAVLERALSTPQAPPVPVLLTALLNALSAARSEALLCLDDLHLVADRQVHEGLEFLVEHAPEGLRLVIATRADPPLPLHRWRARGQLLEVRADELRLSADDTAEMLTRELGRPVGEATVAAVLHATEGWAAGVRLASLALVGAVDTDERALVARLAHGAGYALEYLAEEVLARLDGPLAAFVLDAAALDAFTPDLVDAVTTRGDADARLREARERGLFVQAAPPPEGAPSGAAWWRFHRLFRTLLRGRANAIDAEREPLLRRRAAAWFEDHGAAEVALEYALSSGDTRRGARLLDARAYDLVMQGRARYVERTLERLPAADRDRAQRARLAYGWALLLRGRYDDLAQLTSVLQDEAQELSAGDRAQLLALRAVLADTRGWAHDALALAYEVLDAAPEGDLVTRATAQMALAGARRELGEIGAAIAAYEGAIPLSRAAGLAVPEGLARAHLGLLYLQRGQLSKAISVTQPLEGAAGHPATAAALLSRCSALLERDELAAVRAALPEATALAERGGQPAVLVNAQLTWSRLHEADGDRHRADAALEAARTLVERGVPTWVRALVAARSCEASAAAGAFDAAEAHLVGGEALGARGPVSAALALARVRLLLRRRSPGDLDAALAITSELVANAGASDPGDGVRIGALVVQASTQAASGDASSAHTSLARAVRMAESEGFVRTFVEAGLECAAILGRLGHPYARRLLAAFPSEVRARVLGATPEPALQAATRRERDILRALATAATYGRIADDLGVSVNTVRFHVKNLYAKLGVGTRLEAVERARTLGWLGDDGT